MYVIIIKTMTDMVATIVCCQAKPLAAMKCVQLVRQCASTIIKSSLIVTGRTVYAVQMCRLVT